MKIEEMKICVPPGLPIYGASLSAKLWTPGQTISVRNMNVPSRIWKEVWNAGQEWLKYANLTFEEVKGVGQVGVWWGPGGGSWSQIGTDCLGVERGTPTMSLGWEGRGTYLHEWGHVIGFNHSQNSRNFPYHFDEKAVIAFYSGPPNNWPVSLIKSNILSKAVGGVENEWKQKEVMEYFFPASMIMERVDVSPGEEISTQEKELATQMYPF